MLYDKTNLFIEKYKAMYGDRVDGFDPNTNTAL